MPNTNRPPDAPPGFYPHYGRAGADIINTIFDLANREGFRQKSEEANAKAREQASDALQGKPSGSAAIVRVVETDIYRSPTGNTRPAGEFVVMVESTGESESKAIDSMLMSDQLRPAGETRSVMAYIKRADGTLEEDGVSLQKLVSRSNELFEKWKASGVDSESRFTVAATAAAASGNTAEAGRQQANAKSTREERERVESVRQHFNEVREKAESGDTAAQQELSDMTDDWDRRSRTAHVSQHEDAPTLPPSISPFAHGFSPYLALANANVRSIELSRELRRQLFNRELDVTRRRL
jgi:hypothetical protein